ncbi:MAG TPA: apolipoprotein N-acyltransferase [Candidatus Limnocylindria bacterium]|nr:apolipoprotein N-acyltransferase [Candidatus Limnocylindria bacterium]
MNLPRTTRVLLALGSGVALALSFPDYHLSLLAWASVGMLILASVGARPTESLLYGFLHGLVFYPVCLPWIDTVIQQYGSVDPWSSAGIVGLIGLAGGIIWSSFSWAMALTSIRSPALACALAPFMWVTLEFLRTHLPYIGFPWNLTGYAARGSLALLQLTPVTGVYGLSFLIAAYSSVIAYAILVRSRSAWRTALVVTVTLFLIAIGGRYLVPTATPHRIAHLVQTNFPQSEHYPPNWLQIHAGELDQLEQISVDATKKTPGLIVWPEVPAPFSMQDPAFALRAQRIARESGNYLLIGVVDWKRNAQGQWDASNSSTLLDPSGRRVFTYDKIHLVPFGEYVPLRQWIKFAGRLTADIADFTPGTEYRIGQLPGGGFGVFICYEAIFPDEIRRFARGGAELLINVSNDGWFGRSAAPEQHLMMSRFRAVESRRWMLRDTNNGFTVVVDPYGRIIASLPTDIRGELDAPYDFRSDLTLYARFGDWFAWLCVLTTVVLLAAAIMKRENGKLKMENPAS